MAKAFYAKLAVGNLSRGRRMYGPYCTASAMMSGMFFVILNLVFNRTITNMPTGDVAMGLFAFGAVVMALFTVGYMLYINSFLIRRRKTEFGLYGVLGMERRHVARVILWENCILSGVSLLLGLAGGAVFGRLIFLALLHTLGFMGGSEFTLSLGALVLTCLVFGAIFLLTSLYNLFQVQLASPVDLLRGEKKGEKKTRFAVPMTLLGVALLGTAYYLAVTVRQSVVALAFFWPAVILVILATHLLMTGGSVFVLGALRRNRRLYYKPRNFIAISGLIHRMKQNAAGLANICILSTMVMVTVSCCCALYFGQETILSAGYPDDLSYTFRISGRPELEEELLDTLHESAESLAARRGLTIEDEFAYRSLSMYVQVQDGRIWYRDEQANMTDALQSQTPPMEIIPLEDYNRVLGREETLAADEVILLAQEPLENQREFPLEDGALRVVRQEADTLLTLGKNGEQTTLVVVTPDMETAVRLANDIDAGDVEEGGRRYSQEQKRWNWKLNLDAEQEDGLWFSEAMRDGFYEAADAALAQNQNNGLYTTSSIYLQRMSAYGLYGGLLFLGAFFTVLFLINTVLIIYFKQISEGFDDRERFDILQKVGLSREEVKKTINGQILVVFLLPLAMALMHVFAAANMITQMLGSFLMTDVALTLRCLLAAGAVFVAVYLCVFRLTARTYYRLVAR